MNGESISFYNPAERGRKFNEDTDIAWEPVDLEAEANAIDDLITKTREDLGD